ncbi:MAG: GIY-YIG nuclease family protein [Phycisphaerae bacterium]|nr:GIY-YIG nuclease family protein [Phycisphaerales bacterium]
MAKKPKPLPKVATREIVDGYLHAYDADGRLCLDIEKRERIVLVHDLRTYGDDLHIGALGWTIPETTDGYTFADVIFDAGQKLRLNRYAFERVTVESAKVAADRLIKNNRNTRFDADPVVAASRRGDWVAKYYGEYLTLSETIVKGIGDQELYAFTFPSLIELATARGDERYPVKVGFSKNSSDGALGRIRSQILEKAGFPEKPNVLLVFRTWDGRQLETQVHKRLRSLGRKISASLGREWFMTSIGELLQMIDQCDLADLPPDRAITGADETVEEGFAGLMADGASIEMGMVPGQAAVSISIRYPSDKAEQTDEPERKPRLGHE